MINFEYVSIIMKLIAEIAQLVEHFTRNEGVVSSSLIFSLEKPVNAMFAGFFRLSFLFQHVLQCLKGLIKT